MCADRAGDPAPFRPGRPQRPEGGNAVKALVAAAVALMLFIGGFVGLALVAGTVKAMCGEDAAGRSGGSQSGVSKDAEENIPQRMLDIYQQMGHRYGIDWAVLAGI